MDLKSEILKISAARIRTHAQNLKKDFDAVSMIPFLYF